MPAFNEGNYVRRTVVSLLAETDYPSFDILVLDDASSDGCCERLPRDSRVSVIRREDRFHGVAGAKKIVVEAAKGEYIFCVDAHVRPERPDWLRRLIEQAQRFDGMVMCAPIWVPLDGETWRIKTERPKCLTKIRPIYNTGWWARADPTAERQEVSALRGIGKLFSKKAYEAIGGFDELLHYGGEETDVSIRAWMCGLRVFYVPSVVMGHVFKSKSQFPRSHAAECNIRMWVAYKTLGREAFEAVVENNRKAMHVKGGWGDRSFRSALQQFQDMKPEYDRRRAEFWKHVKRPAEEILERFGITLWGWQPDPSFNLAR